MAQARAAAHSGYRAVTTLTVSFGLVNIPVRVITSTDSKSGGRQFHQYHDHGENEGPGRIRQRRVCEACETEVAFADVVKGLEMPDRVLLFHKDELESLPLASMRSLEVLQFADMAALPNMLFDTNYYLEPDGPTSVTAYAVLMAAMAKKKRVGICKTALREGKEHLAAIRVDGDKLVLTMLRWPSEMRKVHFDVLDGVNVSAPMKKMAEQLVDSMTKEFDPSEYTDEWTLAMDELIDAKAAGKALTAPAPKAPSTTSLEEALLASLSAGSGKKKKAS